MKKIMLSLVLSALLTCFLLSVAFASPPELNIIAEMPEYQIGLDIHDEPQYLISDNGLSTYFYVHQGITRASTYDNQTGELYATLIVSDDGTFITYHEMGCVGQVTIKDKKKICEFTSWENGQEKKFNDDHLAKIKPEFYLNTLELIKSRIAAGVHQ